MGKIIPLNKPKSSFKLDDNARLRIEASQVELDEKKRENSRKDEIHKLDVREINTKYYFKYTYKGIAILFTIYFGFIAILDYSSNIPIPPEIKIGIPISAGIISEIPNILLSLFRKPPP